MVESVNIRILRRVAKKLGPILEDVVFVGGAITSFLLTDKAQPEIRPTIDIDVIIEIGSKADYYKLEDQLRKQGFRNAIGQNQPICRWMIDGTPIDVMPTDPDILGFSNRWYSEAIEMAIPYNLEEDLQINVVSPPYYIAIKLEAFKGRGDDDYLGSHDLEDIITVLDGREELIKEIQTSSDELQEYFRIEFKTLMSNGRFVESIPGHMYPDVASQSRVSLLMKKIQTLIDQ